MNQAEDKLSWLAAIITSSNDAIASKSLDGIITSWNPAAEQLFGYSAAEAVGKPMTIIFPADRQEEEAYLLARVARGEAIRRYETVRCHKDGSHVYVSVNLSPIRDHAGRIVGVSKIAHDLSAQRKLEIADTANQAKSAFLAMMSHELRTPLNSILGFAELIHDQIKGPLGDPEYLEYAGYILSSGHHLLELLNDILDLSKIEAGKMTLAPSLTNLRAIVEDCVQMFLPRARAKGLTLSLEGPRDDAMVWADQRALRQILFNLLSNAVKFTSLGEVRVVASVSAVDNGLMAFRLEIADSGIGISDEDLPLLFTPFTQLGESNSRKFGGTGLGLVITRKLIEMMDGSIAVDSELGRGTRFSIGLPLPLADSNDRLLDDTGLEELDACPDHLRILAAEDNPITQQLLRAMLSKSGHAVEAVELANNGRIALEAVSSGRVDLVLMDSVMPDMNGEQATRAIRSLPAPLNTLPIIALTADAMPDSHARLLAAGVDAVLTKPINRAALLAAVRRFGTRCQPAAVEPPSAAKR